MKNKIDLSIIILNYNTRDLLRDCLKSVAQATTNGFAYETIVVDNASVDGSPAMIKKEFPQIKLIESKKNLGFAHGNNLGIPQATGRYVLFLNPDTVVSNDVFLTMVKFMDENQKSGAATCRVELANGHLDDACHRGFPTPWNAFCHFSGLEKVFPKIKLFSGYSLGHLSLNSIHEIDSGCGAFLIVRRLVGEKTGWWDEDYFFYGEDLDFCYRIKKAGWKIFYVPEVKIIHYKGVSSGIKKHSQKMSTADRETRWRSAKASTQAMRIFYRKHYRQKYPALVNWSVIKATELMEKIRTARV